MVGADESTELYRPPSVHFYPWGLFDKTLRIRKSQICSCSQILTLNLLINCNKSVIYSHFAVNYKEKRFMEQSSFCFCNNVIFASVCASLSFTNVSSMCSVTRWLDYFRNLAIYNNKNFLSGLLKLPKKVHNFVQILNTPSKYC